MNKSVSILRIVILLALTSLAMLFLFGEEKYTGTCTLLQIVIDKGLAIIACILIGRLYRRWRRIDPLLIAYDKMCGIKSDDFNSANIDKDNED